MAATWKARLVDADDQARLHLEVYDTKNGLWNPDLGELTEPDGWEFLASGDAYVTRQVKAAGAYWVLFQPRGRRQHRRQLGLLAPAGAIAAARASAVATAASRDVKREAGARQRERSEATYRAELAEAVRQWLDFAPEHAALADEIAVRAAERAAVVGSGRVGRTKALSLEERAALAARALIRHLHTDYEDRLLAAELASAGIETAIDLDGDIAGNGDYQDVKRRSHRDVDAFLERHRRR